MCDENEIQYRLFRDYFKSHMHDSEKILQLFICIIGES